MNKTTWYNDFKKFYNQINTTVINKHHFESYNSFIDKLVSGTMLNNSYFKLNKKISGIDLRIDIDSDDIELKKYSSSNLFSEFTPNECRLNDKTYALEILIKKVTIQLDDDVEIPVIFDKNEEFVLARIPIQILSNYCNLYNNIKDKTDTDYKNELYKNGECVNELGGYFIIDGKEKVIVSQERLAYNKLYTHTDSSKKYILITEIKSAKINSFSPAKNTYVKLKKIKKKEQLAGENLNDLIENDISEETKKSSDNDGEEQEERQGEIDKTDISIVVEIPGLTSDIPLFIIFRALGYESDKEIYEFILKDLLPYNYSENNNAFTIQNDKFNEFSNFLDTSRKDALPIIDRESALMYIYNKMEFKINLRTNKTAVDSSVLIAKHVLTLLYNNLLPHQNNNIGKGMFLGYMTFNLLKVQLKYEDVSNRDTFEYKQIETSGYLLSTLFREYYIKFKNKILNAVIGELKLGGTVKIDKAELKNKYSSSDLLKKVFKSRLNENIITDGFQRGFKGNWGVRDTQKTLDQSNLNEIINRDKYSFNKEGLVQDLLRVSYLQTISHLRRIQTPIDSNMKIVGPRKLNATQWGYVCPVDTPDGGNSGLIKNLAIGCLISVENTKANTMLTNKFKSTPGFISFTANNYIKPTSYINNTKIFIDGCLIGIYINNDILDILHLLRLIKRNNLKIDDVDSLNEISISFNYEYKELYILTDFGRCIRPVYVVNNNKIIRDNEKYNNDEYIWLNLINGDLSESENKTLSEKIKTLNTAENVDVIKRLEETQACMEFIDPQESLYTLICLDADKITEKKYKYLEINGKLIFGALPSIIPFMNHNPKTRNLFCMAQAKQSVGIFATNFNKRMDTMGHILHYPQTPLVVTKFSTDIKYNDMPGGANVVVAIATYTGYNQEDSVILNRAALDRGLFNSSYYRTYIEYIEEGESFEVPDVSIRRNGNNYNKLNDNGIIKNNTYVYDHDIIIGKITNNDGKITDKSTTIHHNDFGVVDGVYSYEHSKRSKFCKVRIRMERTPQFADKFGSRHGIKGVVGLILDPEDMPFSNEGIVPDIIVNPHSFPSRMSVGHLMECITGKACSTLGSFYDASPFENANEAVNITNMMETLDYEQFGNEILYNGYTGEQMNVSIFMGVQYYQRMKHMVHDKVQSRDTGPKTVLERQPAKGRAREGGLRIGEMERDSIISHGASAFLKESYTIRSDNYKCYVCKMCGRIGIVNPQKNIYLCKFCNNNHSFDEVRIPYCSKLFIQELESQFVSMRLLTDKY